MKELKLRAWHKTDIEKKKFIPFLTNIHAGNVVKFEYQEVKLRHPLTYDLGNVLADDDWIVEQYTGLKDKNGVEIYEGDIIKNKFNKPTLIYFEEGSYKAKIQNNENRSTIYNLGHLLEKWQFRVIGNIHENADLLGGNYVQY